MPETKQAVGAGLDITHACIELIQEHAPAGSREEINNIKETIRQQAAYADEAVDTVALRLFITVFTEFVAEMNKCSPLAISSVPIKMPTERKQ